MKPRANSQTFPSIPSLLLAVVVLVVFAVLDLLGVIPHAEAQMPRPDRSLYNGYLTSKFLETARFTRTLTVDSGGAGDFTSYAAAVAYVSTQNPTAQAPWKIIVYAGQISTGIALPEHVVVEGPDQIRAGGTYKLIGNTGASEIEIGEDIQATSDGSISIQATNLLQLTTSGTAVLRGETSTEIGDQTGAGPTYLRSSVVLRDAKGASLPASCEIGQLFLDTATKKLCACTATNHWACAALK